MMMSDLRVKVDTRHFELYNDLAHAGVVTEGHILFFACACVGFRECRCEEPTRRIEKFWSRTFTPEEWACMYAMALEHWQGDYSRIQDDKVVIGLMEQFATGGLNYLLEHLLRDVTLAGTNEPRLDTSAVRDLPQLLVFELWQLAADNNPHPVA